MSKTNQEPVKAWHRPIGWKPKNPCDECDGTGMGAKTYRGDELVDWDDCRKCEGRGFLPREGERREG